MSVTVIGLTALIADFSAMGARLQTNTTKAVEVTARKVKDAGQKNAKVGQHGPLLAASITYDVNQRGGFVVEGEIGPDKGRPMGALGNIIEYGTKNNDPMPFMGPALIANEGDLYKGMLIAVRQATR